MASKTLPREIIVEILTQLRVKDLLRFRCVSKPWCSLIDGPDFIKLHLSCSLQTNNNTGGVSFDRPSLDWTNLGDLAKISMTVSPDHLRSWKVPVSGGGNLPKDLSLFMPESHVIDFCYNCETDNECKLLRGA